MIYQFWEDFGEAKVSETIIGRVTVEELYQEFKERLATEASESLVSVPDSAKEGCVVTDKKATQALIKWLNREFGSQFDFNKISGAVELTLKNHREKALSSAGTGE